LYVLNVLVIVYGHNSTLKLSLIWVAVYQRDELAWELLIIFPFFLLTD